MRRISLSGVILSIFMPNGFRPVSYTHLIFETECKKGVLGKGVEFVREICQKCPLPVYAIGGMNLQRLPLVIDAGAAGCCMMSGFMQTTKPLQ